MPQHVGVHGFCKSGGVAGRDPVHHVTDTENIRYDNLIYINKDITGAFSELHKLDVS